MPSKEGNIERKPRQNGRPSVGMKIKFYETKDKEDEIHHNGLISPTTQRRNKSTTLPSRRNRPTSRTSLTNVTSELAVYATVNKEQKQKSRERKVNGGSESNSIIGNSTTTTTKDTTYEDIKDFATYNPTRYNRRKKLELDTFQTPSNTERRKINQDPLISPKEISFRTSDDINKIYQYPSRTNRQRRQSEPGRYQQQNDLDESQWKIVESSTAHMKQQKPSSNENSFDELDNTQTHNDIKESAYPETQPTDPKIDSIQAIHTPLSKQDSNTSVLSTVSTSSNLSRKLLALKEDGKTEKQSPRRSRKMKRFSWKRRSGSLDPGLSNTRERVINPSDKIDIGNTRERKRHTISGIQYSETDVAPHSTNSPITSPEQTPNSTKKEQLNEKLSSSNEEDENYPLTKETSATTISLHKYEVDVPYIKPADGIQHDRDASTQSGVSSEKALSPYTPGSKLKDKRSISPSTQTSSKKMQKDKHLIFKFDLDQPFVNTDDHHDTSTNLQQVKVKSALQNARYHRSDEETDHTKKSQQTNKWIQTEGPPIRSPKSQTYGAQVDIRPSHTSKRLQSRPWNLPGHLASNITQTPGGRTVSTSTQTEMKELYSRKIQTLVKTYREVQTQTPIEPRKHNFGIQVSPVMQTAQVQTADEDSEEWGGAQISLDRLIRNGAIKRTRSMGMALTASPERPRDRSASIDVVSEQNRNATQAINKFSKTSKASKNGTQTSGKITSYNWNENSKFVKIFVSYSGIHLLPSRNIQVKTNGINLHLTVDEFVGHNAKNNEADCQNLTSTLYLNRLRRPVSCLSYNIQRDMITIMLRKQKQTPWNALLFGGITI